MADIPEPLTYGRVIWTLRAIGADTSDDEQKPDVYLVSGTASFSPVYPVLRASLSDPHQTLVVRTEVYAITDGVLVGKDGSSGISLLAYDSPGVSPSPVQWRVQVILNEVDVAIPSFPLNVMTGEVVDLSDYVPIDIVPGIIAQVSEETRVRAEEAALRAETAAQSVDVIVQGLLQINEAPQQVGWVRKSAIAVDSINLAPDSTAKSDHWMRAIIVLVNTSLLVVAEVTPPPGWETLAVVRTNQTVSYVMRFKRGTSDTSYTFSFNTICNVSASLDWIRGAADQWDIGPVLQRQIGSPLANEAPQVVARKSNNLISVISVENTAATEAAPTSISGSLTWYFVPQVGGATGTILTATSFQNLAGPSPAVTVTYPNSGPGEGWAMQMAIPGTPGFFADPWDRTLVYVEKDGVPVPHLPAGTPVVTPGEITVGGGSIDTQMINDAVDAALTPTKLRMFPTQLRRWVQAASAQDAAPAKVVFLGSYATEGVGATTWARRFVGVLQDVVRKRPSLGGFTPPTITLPQTGFPCTLSGGAVAATTNPAYSLGWAGRSAVLISDTSKVAFAFTGTQLKVFYAQLTGGSSFTVKIDTVTVATVSTNTTPNRWVQWTSAALTRGSHSVEIQRTGGGAGVAYIRGLQWHDGDENSGVWFYDGGHSGWKAQDFVANEAEWGPSITAIAPDLIVVRVGSDDFAAGRTHTQTETDLLSMIDSFQARQAVPASLIIIGPAQTGGSLDSVVWASWTAMWKSVALQRNGAFIDEQSLLPSPGQLNAQYNVDAINLNDIGHATLATLLLSFSPKVVVAPLPGAGGGSITLPLAISDITGLQAQLDALVTAMGTKVNMKGGSFALWKAATAFPDTGIGVDDLFPYKGP